MKIIVSDVEIMYCHDYDSGRSTVNVWWHSCRNWDLNCIDLPLQASPMKLECLTIGKLGSFRKSLVKWWRWVSEMLLLYVLCICNLHSINIGLELFVKLNSRASSVWCFMTDDFSTQSTSSWKAGAGTGPGIASLTWVSADFDESRRFLFWGCCFGFVCEKNVAVQPFFMCINHPVVKDLWVQGLEDSGDIMEKLLCVKNSFDNSLFHIDPLQISPCPSA